MMKAEPQQPPRRPVPVKIPTVKPRAVPATAAPTSSEPDYVNNNVKNSSANNKEKSKKKKPQPVSAEPVPQPKPRGSKGSNGNTDTLTRTKEMLNEAADAVAKSFAKQTQGINRGETRKNFLREVMCLSVRSLHEMCSFFSDILPSLCLLIDLDGRRSIRNSFQRNHKG